MQKKKYISSEIKKPKKLKLKTKLANFYTFLLVNLFVLSSLELPVHFSSI